MGDKSPKAKARQQKQNAASKNKMKAMPVAKAAPSTPDMNKKDK